MVLAKVYWFWKYMILGIYGSNVNFLIGADIHGSGNIWIWEVYWLLPACVLVFCNMSWAAEKRCGSVCSIEKFATADLSPFCAVFKLFFVWLLI
jgi:hypothetical protein